MKIFFVSGFLGSGKTTSIINASRILMGRGLKVGVVTNDQGKYLVDNFFVNDSGIPSIEVSNGCFCCNYDDFDSHILDIAENEKPDIIFAESVGSCADILATVMKPLSEFRANYSIASSLNAFTDGRLLKARLTGGKLPFSSDVIYIFDKQIEEADTLVINKSDLIGPEDGRKLVELAEAAYPDKKVLFQSAFSDDDIGKWISVADSQASGNHAGPSMEMDYERYAAGELKMAWLDKVFSLSSPSEDLSTPVLKIFEALGKTLSRNRLSVGHLKIFIKPDNRAGIKLSLTGMDETAKQILPQNIGKRVRIVLNARVETEPEVLSRLVNEAISAVCRARNISLLQVEENSFRPGKPQPVHRFK